VVVLKKQGRAKKTVASGQWPVVSKIKQDFLSRYIYLDLSPLEERKQLREKTDH
jgi:hypothetical protein